MTDTPKVYDHSSDDLIEVNQEWCDNTQRALNRLAFKVEVIKMVSQVNLSTDYEKLKTVSEILRNS